MIESSMEDKQHRPQSHEDYFLIPAQTLIKYVILFKSNLKSNLSHFLDWALIPHLSRVPLSFHSQNPLQDL